MKYRKKPIVIDAHCWQPDQPVGNIPHWLWGAVDIMTDFDKIDGTLAIKTLEGTMKAQPGDWIIKGVKNELYPCKPDIFEATYEEAGE